MRGRRKSKMDDTWESNVSPLMMGVGIGDIRGMGDMQPSCSGQDMPQDINPQNMTNHHHQEIRQQNDISQDLNTDMQDLDQDLSHNIQQQQQQQQHPHHQSTLNHNNYYTSHQVRFFTFNYTYLQ